MILRALIRKGFYIMLAAMAVTAFTAQSMDYAHAAKRVIQRGTAAQGTTKGTTSGSSSTGISHGHSHGDGGAESEDRASIMGYVKYVSGDAVEVENEAIKELFNIRNAQVTDMECNPLDRSLIVVGCKVILEFEKKSVSRVVYIHGPLNE